jgi:hypothetical protein
MNTDQPVTTNTIQPVPSKKPVTLKIAAIVLILLILFSSGLALANYYSSLGFGLGNRPSFNSGSPGQQPGSIANNPSGQLPQSFPTLTNGEQSPFFSGGNSDRNIQMPAAFSLLRILQSLALYLNIGLLVIGLTAVFGVWKGKKWGVILAFIIASLVLLLTIPSLFVPTFFFSWLTFVEDAVRIVLAMAVMVLLLLPVSRQAYSTARPKERFVV